MIIMCQCRFMVCNTHSTLDGDSGGGCVSFESKGQRGTVYTLLSFAGNLKLLFKNKVSFKKPLPPPLEEV